MSVEVIAALLGAVGFGGAMQALIGGYFKRSNVNADTTVKIVAASHSFNESIVARLAVVEAQVAILEEQNRVMRAQIYTLGHIPLTGNTGP